MVTNPPNTVVAEGAKSFNHNVARLHNDRQFWLKKRLVQRNIDFLLDRNVPSDPGKDPSDSAYKLGNLADLKYAWIFGGNLTDKDWSILEYHLDRLQNLFTDDLRREWRLLQTKSKLIYIPILLLIYVFVSVGTQVLWPLVGRYSFGLFAMWISGLGALGALSFMSVNSLSIQNDATFDLSDASLVGGRIVLGAVFASVLSLPFCFDAFVKFGVFVQAIADHCGGDVTFDAQSSAKMIAPLLLGFSTSLVLTILNRFVVAVASLFGVEPSKPNYGSATSSSRVGIE
jgi:hypothetical protein